MLKRININIKIVFLVILLISFYAKVNAGILAPGVGFTNMGDDYINNLECNWNGYHLLGASRLIPGQTSYENFLLSKKSDFFGPVVLTWENGVGEKFKEEFVMKKSDLPSAFKKGGKDGVRFYFTQEGVEYYTSDHPDIEKIEKKNAKKMRAYGMEYQTGYTPEQEKILEEARKLPYGSPERPDILQLYRKFEHENLLRRRANKLKNKK